MKEVVEEFRDILGYEGMYQVSNLGRIKSLDREIKWGNRFRLSKERILKQSIMNTGYYVVNLRKRNKSNVRTVHQLVAEAFLNHIPNRYKIVVDHINNNPLDNRVENLQLISQRENASKDKLNGYSSFIGVTWSKERNKWRSSICTNNNKINLGTFNTEEEASEYYQNALKAIENNEEIVIKKHIFSSKYKGVSWRKSSNKWIAVTTINGKTKHIGLFNTELEAHNAYQNKLKEIQNEG